jgi:aspartyl-tRNA synthetase
MEKLELSELSKKIGEELEIIGWVNSIRSHGKLVFIDLRDRSATVQLVFAEKGLAEKAAAIKTEDLISVKGVVQKRPPKLVNPNILTGEIEFAVSSFEAISKMANDLPFAIDNDTRGVSEQIRLKYRYLDLRSQRMKDNMIVRHNVILFLRNYFSEKGFLEIETPLLTKGTPEGSREFIVPSRLYPGEFYVLPQSPQQFKQLLMVAGLEKYFQIAKCFRDEDQRSDRQPEFTQLDMEMSFPTEEGIMALMEGSIISLVEKLFPDRKIAQKPFPKMTYAEAMEKYNSDKPDLREEKNPEVLHFCWVVDFPMFEYDKNKQLTSCHHPFTSPKDEDVELLSSNPVKARAKAYDLVLNGYEVGGGSIRIHKPDLQKKIFEILNLKEEEIQSRFGHIINAFTFSPPPHGGIALGLDRLICLLLKEESIREVMAFPKTGDAKDLMMGAPSLISKDALHEAHIKISEK